MQEGTNIAKQYDPKDVEERLYKKWLDNNYFNAKIDRIKKPYTIVIPPPNITGQLHMGHALDNTVQDILIRWKRMQDFVTLWLPGTDHASIATEAKIVEAMSKEGLTKEALGRDKFLEHAWNWKKLYGGKIIDQLKKLGSSCDWSRERFTMDEGLSHAVKEVFIRLYNEGLIYRGERIINWCPKCNTSISDAEVDYQENQGYLWHIKYTVADNNEYIVVATTRPETMLGDTAVAVHPDDLRYKHLIGKNVVLPLMNREIPIIADTYVEKEFGTGAVKITPAHDPNDFEVGLRHRLPQIKIMNDNATMNENAKQYSGMDRYEARKRIIDDLQNLELLIKIDNHTNNIGTCYRCSTVIEPIISKQWFVHMKPLAKPAIEIVKNGTIKFVPERFAKIYYNWMENIQDWCISRQLWWGHRIPAFYCIDCNDMVVGETKPSKCSKCNSTNIKQDPDTLDTWFSSALWPFSTLGWPTQAEDLNYFYPTDVLVTAYDIIFFWVARMIFSGVKHMGKEPFKYVFIHGIVRDEEGRKMSKSLGNGIDPIEIIDKYGTDALRFSLIIGTTPGNDLRFSSDKVEFGRNFANKIWNASRFVLMNFDESIDFNNTDLSKMTFVDKWILSKSNTLIKEVTENLNKFELGIALKKVYEFIWDEFCDWYIELVKPRLYDKENETREVSQYVLNQVLGTAMKLLHPFMPFITEEIYMHLINNDESIMISKWPKYSSNLEFFSEETKIKLIVDSIRSIRNIRSEMNVPPSRKAKIIFVTKDAQSNQILKNNEPYFIRLASASKITIQDNKDNIPENAVSAVIEGCEIFIPLAELVDIEKEIERLSKEKENLSEELNRANGKLDNEGFLTKAPQKLIDEEKAKKLKYQEMYDNVVERINNFKN